MSTATKSAPDEVVRKKSSTTTASGLAVKLILVGLIDALLVWALIQCISDGWTWGVGFFIFALIAVNLVYFTRGLPMKYLLPGLMFLLVYQLFTMLLTGYTSFTNYGTGHLGDKDSAISALLAREEQPVADSAAYPVVPIEKGGTVSMLVTFPEGTDQAGQTFIGTPESLDPGATRPAAEHRHEGHRRHRLPVAEPRHHVEQPGLHRPVGRAARPAQRGHGHLPEVLEHLRGQGVQVRLRVRRGPPTR